MDETNNEFLMRRNLTDAGFPESEIARIISLLEEGRETAVHRILAQHRTDLLNTVHENQKRIDCLDYLVYDMNNNSRASLKIRSDGFSANGQKGQCRKI